MGHRVEYLGANHSYCHTCKRTIPNAHARQHMDADEDWRPAWVGGEIR